MKASYFAGLFVIVMRCLSCASSPDAENRAGVSGNAFVVTHDFQFTAGSSAVSRMNHTWTIPAGVYHAVGSDSGGTYYVPPNGWLWLKARHSLQMHVALCRRGNTFLICSQVPGTASAGLPEGVQLIGKLFFGSKARIWDAIPPEFNKSVERR